MKCYLHGPTTRLLRKDCKLQKLISFLTAQGAFNKYMFVNIRMKELRTVRAGAFTPIANVSVENKT
jgi:hypothetical protein